MKKIISERHEHISLWIGAVLVGVAAVLFAKVISLGQSFFFARFSDSHYLVSVIAPFLFVGATFLVRRFGPDAKGSGIPQILEAIEFAQKTESSDQSWKSPLISIRTAIVKVISALVGILGGASIGREGPTVQIAASVFAIVGRKVKRYSPNISLPSYLTAGASAGVAAAFNTPLAGITFVIEEMVDGALNTFKQSMMIAVIIAGITAQSIMGDYLYFGRPNVSEPNLQVVYQAVLIGLAGGFLGGIFARVLAYPKFTRLPKHWISRAFICGIICSAIGLMTAGATAGSGYEATEKTLTANSLESISLFFPLLKMVTTILSYLSGMAGGIFSPSLSIGAGIGVALAKILHFSNFKTCALMGMVAFFSGVVQAPLTAVIIVTEMTDRHVLILPFMVAAFVGQIIGKRIMPMPLYHFLAKRHQEG